MIEITIFESPFNAEQKTVLGANPGDTLAEFLTATGLAERMEREPIVVRCAGADVMRADYETLLVSGDVTLHVLPQGGSELIWYAVATVLISAAVSYYMQDQLDTKSGPDRSPTYDINARGNAARLGSPKPVFYGRMRTYPDLGALPYTEFDKNGDQILYQLFEVRQGLCDINVADMRFEDTPITSFEGYEVEVIAPGARSTIYPGQVVVSTELSSIEIGPTPNDYGNYKDMKHNVDSAPDASYYACDIGQTINRIALDITAPNGLWRSNDEGKILYRQVGVRLEARKVDDANQPLGNWFALGNVILASDSANYRNAVRRTFSYTVPAGRYEVRTVRTTTKTDRHQVSDTLNWVGLRGYTGDALPLVTTTRIALKIRASEQLSDRGAGKFNVVSTGKIPVWHPITGWSEPQVTSNPAWVFADILRNETYGGGRGDAYIDLPGLYALSQQYATAGIEFHAGFDTETTVWDALKKVAAVGRAVPVDRAGVYYMVPDVQSSVPAFMFTHSNIVKDSFRIDYSSVVEETFDAYRVSFLDKTQAYRETSFICALPGSPQEKIKDIKLFGCVDRQQAFNWAMYLLAVAFYRRNRVELQTGIEGYLPFFYDTIAVSHYLIGREGQKQISGDVVAFDGVDLLTLGEDTSALTNPHIILRRLDGSLTSAYEVDIINTNQVRINEPFDASVLVFQSGYDRPHFMLGEGEQFYARVKIDSIKSVGNNRYTISGFVDAPEVYDAAAGLPLPPITELPPVLNLAPVVSNLRVVLSGTVDTPQAYLRWDARNADYFIVQTSADGGATWATINERLTDKFLIHNALVGEILYRVCGVNFLQGQWVEITVDTGEPSFVPPEAVTDLELGAPFTGTSLRVQWVSQYLHHKVGFYLGGEEKYSVDVVGEVTSYVLYATTARAQGLGRSFEVRVWSVSQYGKLSDSYASLNVTNPLPGALNNLSVSLSIGTVFVRYDLPTDIDFDGVSIWASTENNFTPSNANRVAERIRDTSFSFEMPDTMLYVRVAALDVWGDDYFVSGQYTLDPNDTFERLTGEIVASHLHQSLREPIELIDAPGIGLVAQITNEVSARLALAQQLRGDYTGTDPSMVPTGLIAQQRIETNNSINQLASQMALLSAGGATQFDHVNIWLFDAGAEGWITNGGGAASTASPGWIKSANATDPFLSSPATLLSVDGAKYTQVRLRIKKVGSPTWIGRLRWYTVDDPAFDTVNKVKIVAEPGYTDGVANLTFTMDTSYWVGKTIERLRFELIASQDASNYLEIDWIAVGRPSPGASSAELFAEQQARIAGDNANANAITLANAQIANKANQSALDSLSSTVTNQGDTLTAQGNRLTVLDSQLYPQAINKNCSFADWPAGDSYPAHYAAWNSSGLSRHTGTYAYSGGNAVRYVTNASNNSGFYVLLNNSTAGNAAYVDIEIVFTLVSGSLSGAGLLLDWNNSSTGFSTAIAFKDFYTASEIVGKKTIFKGRLRRPANFSGTFVSYTCWAMANYAGNGLGALSAKEIIFDRIVLTVADASAQAIQSLDTRVSSAEGNINSQASAITQLQASAPGGGNLIPTDTEFTSDASGWALGYNDTGTAITFQRNTWHGITPPTQTNALVINSASATSGQFSCGIANVPVMAGARYCFSAWLSVWRGRGSLYIFWNGQASSSVSSAGIINNAAQGELTNWHRASLFATAPAGAKTATLLAFCDASPVYGSHPFLFVARPMFSEVDAGVTVPPKYAPSGAPSTTAAVRVTAEAAASTANGAVARWEVKTAVGDLTGGVGFWNDGVKTRFAIHADQFYVFSPGAQAFSLVVNGGKVMLPGDLIVGGSIKTAQLEVGAVTASSLFNTTSSTVFSASHQVTLSLALGTFSSTGVKAKALINGEINLGDPSGASSPNSLHASTQFIDCLVRLRIDGTIVTTTNAVIIAARNSSSYYATWSFPIVWQQILSAGNRVFSLEAVITCRDASGVNRAQNSATGMSMRANCLVEENKV